MSVSDWEHLTPRELMLVIQAHGERNRDSAKGKRVETYNLAGAIRAMVLSKHAPTFERLFPGDKKREVMTDEQMLKQVRAFNRMFGGTED